MTDLPVVGPLGELHLGHEARLDLVVGSAQRAGWAGLNGVPSTSMGSRSSRSLRPTVVPAADAGPGPLSGERLDAIALVLAGDPAFVARPRFDPSLPAEQARSLVGDISARLGRVCGHLGAGEFTAPVLDVARMRLRFQRIERDWAAGGALVRNTP